MIKKPCIGLLSVVELWLMMQPAGRKTKFKAEYPADFVFDYKDPVSLARFVTDGGKIASSRISKLSYRQQRRLTRAIKRARNLALLPLGGEAYSTFGRPAQISAQPFDLAR